MMPVSKKRLFTTTVGIILAVAIIFTSYTLGNNMARQQFYWDIEKNPYQINLGLSGNITDMMNAYNEILNLSHVSRAILSVETIAHYSENGSVETPIPINYLKGYNITLVNGTYLKRAGEILVSPYTFKHNNWSLNQNITLMFYGNNPPMFFVNYTIVGVADWGIPNQETNVRGFIGILVNYSEMLSLAKRGVNFRGYLNVAIDPGYLLNSTDYNEASKKIDDITNQVFQILSIHDVQYMQTSFYYYGTESYGLLIYALFFSLPVIIMGAYLSRVGIEIEFLERRREFGILKIRGATGWSLSKLVIVEAVIYSIIGGVVGYILGEGLAYLSNLSFFKMSYFILDWSWEAMVGAIVTSAILFTIALYTPWNKIKKEPIISLISHYSQSFKKVEYNKLNRDIILSGFMWGYIIILIWLMKNVNFTGGLNIIVIIAFILMQIGVLLFPMILIILPLTMSRLLTMGTNKVYKFIASGVAKIFRTSGELAERSIERSPKRAAYLAFILAFILTLSSFLAVELDTTGYTNQLMEDSDVGGDISLNLDEKGVPWKILNDTQKVSKYVIIYEVNTTYGSSIYEANMEKYINTIYHGEAFLKDGKLDGSGVVITLQDAKSENLKVGDSIEINFGNTIKTYKVEAIMYSFPGINDPLEDVKIIDVKKPSGTPSKIILRSDNLTALKKELVDQGYYDYNIRNNENGMETSQLEFINTLLIYLVILGAASIFIVQYSSLLNRRGEIALYKVRGARNKQMAAMLMTEGITVITISLMIGVSVGITLAYALSSLMEITTYLPPVFVIGKTLLVYTLILVFAYILSQYILSYVFARTKPSEVIRGLGGEI